MRNLKDSFVMTVIIALATLGIGASQAAGETVSSSASYKPVGTLYETQARAVGVHLEGKVLPDPGATKLRELINIKLNLPKDLSFWPQGTQACKADIGQFNENNANRPTAAVVAECPKSVVGDGTAVINVAGYTSAPVKDPVLTIFNAGRDNKNRPKLLIHGYSATVVPGGHGIIMTASLVNGTLDVKVPKLAADSAVSEFEFDLPGKRGLDPKYTRATCSSGTFRTGTVFTLADSDPNTGGFINQQNLTATPTFQDCVGKVSKAHPKLKRPKVYGKRKHFARQGKRRAYFVKVKNYGRKVAKRVRVKAYGKRAFGKRYVGKLRPGQAKKVKVKVRFRKRGKIRTKFRVNARGAKGKTKTIRVRVK